ncbi:PDZ domain-containing protein [Aeromicrobium phragmitis]|uniref:PDZ domain-containing protein n=1 Tax=Aeromicrobium phragmitis TaxID=2478914 RepID=A0A3L8PQ59_9ACTN|nr:trypsin-like peptidase domain-containing protein [Aeromicrobium phragmitis]RLV57545.1 PDZ domain-containing protein [Aeromicrobium phragmitis]
MTDSHDPYADRPYVPPTGPRGPQDPASPATPARGDENAGSPTGPSGDQPPRPTPPAEPHGDPLDPNRRTEPAGPASDQPPRPTPPAEPHGDPLDPNRRTEPTGPASDQPPQPTPPAEPHGDPLDPNRRDDDTARFSHEPSGPAVPPRGPDTAREAHVPQGEPFGPDSEHTTVLGAPPPGSDATSANAGATPPTRRGRLVAAVIGIVLLAGASGVGGAALYDEFSNDSGLSPRSTNTGTSLDDPASSDLPAGTVEQVAQKLMPSVVQINFAGGGEGGSGTGVIISEDGQILTNNHVVEAAAEGGTLTVAFNDGTNADATILGRDPATDIAVIQADGVSDLTPAEFGRSSDVRVGQEVVAIGSPFGLESTVTQGIISALNRPVSPGTQSSDTDTITTFPAIQTDAAINPGNSGGPLVDLEGRVIGINSAIRSSGIEGGSIGLGFAIPSDLARNVAAQILDGETVEHARIGITVQNATGDDQITGIGARVADVEPGGPGDDAGLREGDIVTSVDDHPVASNQALIATIRGYQPGDEVTLTILRDGQQEQVQVTLGSDQGDLAR